MSRTNFRGPKDVRAIEVRLYKENQKAWIQSHIYQKAATTTNHSFLEAQKEEGMMRNTELQTEKYSETCVRQPPLKLTLVVDVERWLSYKGTCHVILLAKLHDMYLYKTDNFYHINHYLVSLEGGSLTEVLPVKPLLESHL